MSDVLDLFVSLYLLLTMKGCEVYLSNQKFTSYELTYENPLKILVSLFVLYIFAFVWFFFFFFLCLFKKLFLVLSLGIRPHVQITEKPGEWETAKVFVYPCRSSRWRSWWSIQCFSCEAVQLWKCCAHVTAASQGFCLHPQLSGKAIKAFRKKMNVS